MMNRRLRLNDFANPNSQRLYGATGFLIQSTSVVNFCAEHSWPSRKKFRAPQTG